MLDKDTEKLMIKVKKVIIELPKILELGGTQDIGDYFPTFPFDGFINFAYPFDLSDKYEVKQLLIIRRNPLVILEEQRVTFSVQKHYAETTRELK